VSTYSCLLVVGEDLSREGAGVEANRVDEGREKEVEAEELLLIYTKEREQQRASSHAMP